MYKKKDETTKQITALPYGATNIIDKAEVIAGLNGPMAHIYLNNSGRIGKVAELLRLSIQGEYLNEALKWWDMDDLDYRYFKETKIGRMKSSVDKILIRISDNYCVFDGLNADGSMNCAITDPFPQMEYPNAWERIKGVNHPKRSGDIILLMKDDINNIDQRFTAGVSCKSWHGSLNRSDSYVPFIFAYPGGNQFEINRVLKRENICKEDYRNCRGNWKMAEIIKEIISEQYK